MAEQHVKGFDQLSRWLLTLPSNLAKKHLTGAVGAGAKLIRDDAQQRAMRNFRTGALHRSIIIKYIPEQSSKQQAVYYVTVRKGRNRVRFRTDFDPTTGRKSKDFMTMEMDAYYARFLEFGTAKMQAQPFMRPAVLAKQQQAFERIAERLASGLEKDAEGLT